MNQLQFPQNVNKVLQKFNIKNPKLLGKGGEGLIFDFDDKALKIYDNTTEEYLQNIFNFQKTLSKYTFSFKVPQIIEIGNIENTFYTIESELNGVQADKLIPALNSDQRKILFSSYYNAIKQINSVELPDYKYGQIIKAPDSITSVIWVDYLINKLRQKVAKSRNRLTKHIKDYDQKSLLLETVIKNNVHSYEKKLVHCDYYLNNVLIGDNLTVSAILDFSIHAVVGDPRLDVSGVLTWNTMDKNIKPSDYNFLYEVAEKDYGKDIYKHIDIYLLYSSFYYGDMEDPSFSINNLNQERIWRRVS